MFQQRYFSGIYFPAVYFVEAVPRPRVGVYFAPRYFSARYTADKVLSATVGTLGMMGVGA